MLFFQTIEERWHDYQSAVSAFYQKNAEIHFTGLAESAKAHFVCLLLNAAAADRRKAVYLAPNDLAAKRIYQDFVFFLGEKALLLEAAEYMLYDVEARSSDTNAGRMKTLKTLLEGDWTVLVLPPSALIQWLPAPEILSASFLTIAAGDTYEPYELAEKLTALSYERVSQVGGNGQFSLRGDILDVYPYGADHPFRIEFFDNEIDSIRSFDLMTQRSLESIGQASLLPARETAVFTCEQEQQAKNAIRSSLNRKLTEFSGRNASAQTEYAEKLRRRISADIEKISTHGTFPGYDRYLPFILGNTYSILDYTGSAAVIADDRAGIEATIQALLADHLRVCETLNESIGILPELYTLYMDSPQAWDRIRQKGFHTVYLEEFLSASSGRTIAVPCKTAEAFGGSLTMLMDQVRTLTEQDYTVVILAETDGKAQRLRTLLQEARIASRNLHICTGGLHSGFVYPSCRFAVISDGALFKKESRAARKKLRGAAISSFAEISPGDLVVHEIHGIGRFDGIESIDVEGVRRDYIKILYRDNGVLYVPTHQLSAVQKYIGPEESAPKLNKLGSSEWERTTARVKDSLRAYAKELVELYARREKIKGHAYPPDTVWQQEFEEAFVYEETDDQLKCVEEIKMDMERIRPMERLLCGDVGYGKTEVALRAAFKAVCDGKQVAFLVPTTVLAQQHYTNFKERFKQFPVTIDYICRFRTAAEKREVLKSLQSGKIDIIVGTHSLIKSQVKFHDLGLVIIDEEQRFGVMHKEKLKQDNPTVDILTLSATPIPRTLHMSLSGIRDISLIEDPPGNRRPVQTYVAEWEPSLIRNAIYRELGRKGQVFYLYNKVKTMHEKLRQLQEIVPEARIAVAHGQMGERELEDVMEAFLKGAFDVLLCTTIIESGLDMPNVNTVIIENSDHMGLAQLYQIRGRVGRSHRLAYAYITYKKDKVLSETAAKRLRTIRDFTEFGSGFKIALRDLEIRGAGSVLGEKQHGQLAVVGYDAYCRLLSDVLQEEQGIQPQEKVQVSVEFRVNAYIDSHYIEDEEARLDIYQKISRVETAEDAIEMTDELIDRYGHVPENVGNLIKISQIRYLCSKLGFNAVIQKPTFIQFMLQPGQKFPEIPDVREPAFLKYRSRVTLHAGKEPYLSLLVRSTGNDDVLSEILEFLQFCHCQNIKTGV